MSLLRDLGHGLADLIYPPLCLSCGQPAAGPFCAPCHATLASDPFCTCLRCGSTVGPHSATNEGCPRCKNEHFSFSSVVRLGPYEGQRREMILRMKNDEVVARAVGAVFAEEVGLRVRHLEPTLVIPVPLHWKRRWQRGYNQAEVLANALAAHLRVPCRPRLLRRIRMTPSQTGLSGTARRENLRGAILVRTLQKDFLKGRVALLVDDVFTTGSTVQAAAVVLKSVGVSAVHVAVAAHG